MQETEIMRNWPINHPHTQKLAKSHSKSTKSAYKSCIVQSGHRPTTQLAPHSLPICRKPIQNPIPDDWTCKPIIRTTAECESGYHQRLSGPQGQQTFMSSFSYRVGGSLTKGDNSYVMRQADTELLEAIRHGRFAYVFAPRQMGKSSLRIQTRHQLEAEGYQCASLQANQLVDRSQPKATQNQGLEQQTNRLMLTLWDGFAPASDALSHKDRVTTLNQTTGQSTATRLHHFVQTTLAPLLQQRALVVFIDEFDALMHAPLAAELLRWIEQCYQARTTHANNGLSLLYQNLNFVVLGSAIAADFSTDSELFSEQNRIALEPFNQSETTPLQQGFAGKLEAPQAIIDAVFHWTQGQPFLTQKLCHILQTLIKQLVQTSSQPLVLSADTIQQWVNDTVRTQIIQDWPQQDEPVHLRAISDRITRSPNKTALKSLYKRIYAGTPITPDNSHTQAELMLSGIVISRYNQLQIANEIYRHVFPLR